MPPLPLYLPLKAISPGRPGGSATRHDIRIVTISYNQQYDSTLKVVQDETLGQILRIEWLAYSGQVEKSVVQLEAALRIAKASLQSWLIQEVLDVQANVDDCRHDFTAVSAWVEQCDPARVIYSRALAVYCRHIAATQPLESAITTIHGYLDNLAVQGLALKQIEMAAILAQLYMQAEQPQEAERQVANAVVLAFQNGIVQPFVAQARVVAEQLRWTYVSTIGETSGDASLTASPV
jgi:hypothetical protein